MGSKIEGSINSDDARGWQSLSNNSKWVNSKEKIFITGDQTGNYFYDQYTFTAKANGKLNLTIKYLEWIGIEGYIGPLSMNGPYTDMYPGESIMSINNAKIAHPSIKGVNSNNYHGRISLGELKDDGSIGEFEQTPVRITSGVNAWGTGGSGMLIHPEGLVTTEFKSQINLIGDKRYIIRFNNSSEGYANSYYSIEEKSGIVDTFTSTSQPTFNPSWVLGNTYPWDKSGGNNHFAIINQFNIVQSVIVITEETVLTSGKQFLKEGEKFVQTSYGNLYRGTYAGIGYIYDHAKDLFYYPTPTYTLTPSTSSINEGSTLTTSVATTDVASGTTLYYSLSGSGINTSDFSSGALTGSGTVGSNGSFSFSHTFANDLTTEGTETLNIKLYADSSRSTQVGSTASVSINDTSITATQPAVISIVGAIVIEGNVSTVLISRTGNTAIPVAFTVATANGTATSGQDYTAISSNYLLAAGENSKSITIATIDDTLIESDEAFTVTVSSANASIGTASASVTIGDNDSNTYSYFSLADAITEEGKTASVTITRSGDTSSSHIVALSTSNNTATAGADYNAYSGNITFTPGQISNTLALSTIDDTSYEGNEFFNLTGGSISGGTNNVSAWSTATAKITILDNDVAPASTIDASSFTALSLTPETLPAYSAGNAQMDKYYYYVERYPLTLRTAFIADYFAGRTTNEAIWGQNHYFNEGIKNGRVLEVVTGEEDTKDYGAYVENYGTTLLDIYRKDARASINGGNMSMFAWGKEHYNNTGMAAGRQIDGGVDWGAIVLNNLDLYNKWQDSRRINPTQTAFAYGYNNQSSITQQLDVKIGSDNQDKLTGGIVYGMNANDVLVGTAGNNILAGGFGDDLIVGVNGGSDIVYGGPGRDVFQLNAGTALNIRDFRKGADMIQLGNALTSTGITLQWGGGDNSTYFYQGSSILAKVFGKTPTDFTYADSSSGMGKVYI